MTMRLHSPSADKPRGFSFVELMVVLFVIALMTTVVAPAFSSLIKGTKLKQATEAVMGAVYRARHEAQIRRTQTAFAGGAIPTTPVIFFGEDTTQPLAVQPSTGILPPYGQIEIWTASYSNTAWGSSANPTHCFDTKWHCLSPQPITFLDPIRILVGSYHDMNPKLHNDILFSFGDTYTTDGNPSKGEVSRHQLPFFRGRKATVFDLNKNANLWDIPNSVLLLDNYTGENEVVIVTDAATSRDVRPYLAPYAITAISYSYTCNLADPPTWTPPAELPLSPPPAPFATPQKYLVSLVNNFTH